MGASLIHGACVLLSDHWIVKTHLWSFDNVHYSVLTVKPGRERLGQSGALSVLKTGAWCIKLRECVGKLKRVSSQSQCLTRDMNRCNARIYYNTFIASLPVGVQQSHH